MWSLQEENRLILGGLKSKDFSELRVSPERKAFRTEDFLFFYMPKPEEGSIRKLFVAFSVSKKIGKAVLRNRVRRLLREGFKSLPVPNRSLCVNVVPLASSKDKFSLLNCRDVTEQIEKFYSKLSRFKPT